MTTRVELRIVRCTDGTIDVESCEFDAEGKIVAHVPYDECWFAAFLGGSRGELAPWLKEQIINAFTAGYNCALTANWMADSTVMTEQEPRPSCTTLALSSPKPDSPSS